MPAWFKETSEFPSAAELTKLASVSFADVEQRLHPLHTKEACYLTACYLSAQRDVADSVLSNVKRAAAVFGIADEVGELLKESAKKEEAPPEGSFALSEGEHHFYPTGTPFDITMSLGSWQEDLVNHKLPAAPARKSAVALLKRATAEGIEVPAVLEMWGSEDPVDLDLLRKQANARAHMYQDTEKRADVLAVYDEIINQYAGAPSEELRVKAAACFMEADQELRISRSLMVLPPERLWFGSAPKLAKQAAAGEALAFRLGGVELPLIALSSVPSATAESWFAGTAASAVKQAHQAATVGDGEKTSEALAELSPALIARLASELDRYHS